VRSPKRLLEEAPLEGVWLDRSRDAGRPVDIEGGAGVEIGPDRVEGGRSTRRAAQPKADAERSGLPGSSGVEQ